MKKDEREGGEGTHELRLLTREDREREGRRIGGKGRSSLGRKEGGGWFVKRVGCWVLLEKRGEAEEGRERERGGAGCRSSKGGAKGRGETTTRFMAQRGSFEQQGEVEVSKTNKGTERERIVMEGKVKTFRTFLRGFWSFRADSTVLDAFDSCFVPLFLLGDNGRKGRLLCKRGSTEDRTQSCKGENKLTWKGRREKEREKSKTDETRRKAEVRGGKKNVKGRARLSCDIKL